MLYLNNRMGASIQNINADGIKNAIKELNNSDDIEHNSIALTNEFNISLEIYKNLILLEDYSNSKDVDGKELINTRLMTGSLLGSIEIIIPLLENNKIDELIKVIDSLPKMNNLQDSRQLFKEPVTPTKEELKTWAYGNYYYPEQDFQLFVVQDPYFALELALDNNCPTRDFFLESLYIWVGDSVRNGLSNKEELIKWLNTAEKSTDQRIKKLIERARYLINHPDSYDYSKWGIGGEYTNQKFKSTCY